jgi:hypothetical protein
MTVEFFLLVTLEDAVPLVVQAEAPYPTRVMTLPFMTIAVAALVEVARKNLTPRIF